MLSLSRSYRVYQSTGVFLLVQRNHLGIQAFDDLITKKWSLDADLAGGSDQKWKKINRHQNKSYNSKDQFLGILTNTYQETENPSIISVP